MQQDETTGESVSYLQVAKALRDEIRSGAYADSGTFPSLTKIMKRFGVSRPSAVRSVAELKRLGLVGARKGAGTFVLARNRTIGLALPGTADSDFFSAVMDGLVFNCRKYGFDMIAGDVFAVDHDRRDRQAERLAHHFAAKKVAGVVMQPVGFSENADRINGIISGILDKAEIPVVLIDYDIVPSPERSRYDLVAIDNFNAGRKIASHLLGVGARRICCLLRPLCADSVHVRFAGVDSEVRRSRGRRANIIVAEPYDESRRDAREDAPPAEGAGSARRDAGGIRRRGGGGEDEASAHLHAPAVLRACVDCVPYAGRADVEPEASAAEAAARHDAGRAGVDLPRGVNQWIGYENSGGNDDEQVDCILRGVDRLQRARRRTGVRDGFRRGTDFPGFRRRSFWRFFTFLFREGFADFHRIECSDPDAAQAQIGGLQDEVRSGNGGVRRRFVFSVVAADPGRFRLDADHQHRRGAEGGMDGPDAGEALFTADRPDVDRLAVGGRRSDARRLKEGVDLLCRQCIIGKTATGIAVPGKGEERSFSLMLGNPLLDIGKSGTMMDSRQVADPMEEGFSFLAHVGNI